MRAHPPYISPMAKRTTLDQLIACGLEESAAAKLLPRANEILASPSPTSRWKKLSREVLKPEHPFRLHKLLFETAYGDWDPARGPAPAWFPEDGQAGNTNIAALTRYLKLDSYPELHAWSAAHRLRYWELMIQRLGIRLRRPYTAIADLSRGAESPGWLAGARLNIAESCFQAAGDSPAIVYQPQEGPISTMRYKELLALSGRVANALDDSGFSPGDAVALCMPMTAESAAAYLGIIQAGCVAVSIADSFAPHEIEVRLRLANARAVFTQDILPRLGAELPLYAKVAAAHAPRAIVIPAHPPDLGVKLRPGDTSWEDFLSPLDRFEPRARRPCDHINILFSSGTTGEPKAIPWNQTTPIKCAADGHMHHDIHPGDVVAWPTNLGWMMGPWLIFASLINKATMALYYDAPTGRGFGRFVEEARISVLGVVPSLVRAWKETGCMEGLDWSAIKAFSSTGECSNPDDMLYLMSLAGYRPVVEYCGGTEIGGGYMTSTTVQPAAPSTFTTPALGLDFAVLDGDGEPADSGELFLLPPSIGLSTELLNRDHHEVYFAGTPPPPGDVPLRRHGDQVERLGNNQYRALGRADDTMNLSGIKVSSAEIERTLNSVRGISETAAIAVPPLQGGPSQLVVYAVVSGEFRAECLKESLQAAIRRDLNPLFRIGAVVIVESLPRTASGKVMRRVLRDEYRAGFKDSPEAGADRDPQRGFRAADDHPTR